MNDYLIFRTDRVGDFLISAVLINNIKLNNPDSHITVIASSKNASYIKSFNFVNDVIELKNSIFSKIKIIIRLLRYNFKSIIIHDDKKRSKFISFFLRSNNKIYIKNKNDFSHINLIKKILQDLNLKFFTKSLDFLEHKTTKLIKKNNIQLHFDEKWIHKNYIDNYINIEPTEIEFINFLSSIIKKKNTELIITTGIKSPVLLRNLTPKLVSMNIKFYEGMSFHELENITLTSNTLISCHGALSHVASANQIKQFDIIDKSYDYSRWTDHFRNYNFLYRENFNILSKKIIDKI